MTARLVDDRIFAATDPLVLGGGRCTECATTTFPMQDTCPRCFTQEMADQPLPTSGVLWSWTMQFFAPKPPFRPPAEGFAPYLLGYVDLGPVIVEARLTGWGEGPPAIGEPVELAPLVAFTDEDGTEVVTFAFSPATRTTPATATATATATEETP